MSIRKILTIFILLLMLPAFAGKQKTSLYDTAIEEHSRAEYQKELKTIEKIEAKEGESAKTNLMKFRAFSELDMFDEAKSALNRALSMDKKSLDNSFALAILAIENNDTSSARKYFKTALDMDSDLINFPEVLYWYAKLCAIDNDLPSALEYILSAIEKDPDENLYYLELGKIYLYKKDYIKAVNALSFAIGKNAEIDAESYNYLGLIQYRRKSYKKARENFEKAHFIEPNNVMYLHNLLLCVKNMGDKTAYQNLITELTSITPKTPLDYLHFSQIAFDKSEYSKAHTILKEGMEKFPNNLMLKQAYKNLNKS